MPTEAQNRATYKWRKKAYDRIELFVTKGQKEEIKKHAEKKGMSLNGYINELIKKDMENMNG